MEASEREIRIIVFNVLMTPVPHLSRPPESKYYVYKRTLAIIRQRGLERPSIFTLRRIVDEELEKSFSSILRQPRIFKFFGCGGCMTLGVLFVLILLIFLILYLIF